MTLVGYNCFAFPLAMAQTGKVWMYDMPWKHTNLNDFKGAIPSLTLDLALLGLALAMCCSGCKKSADLTVTSKATNKKSKSKSKDTTPEPLKDYVKKDSKPQKAKNDKKKK